MDRVERLKQFLADNPGDSFVKHALALEYIKGGDELIAQQLFEEILEKDPTYIGSYYHLAKLFERAGKREEAINWYKAGMQQAMKAGEGHALNELRAAHDELADEY